jgi:hypothetical protein
VLLWGDSVAAHLSSGLRAVARGTDIDILQATTAGCPPALGLDPRKRPHCKQQNEGVLRYVENHRPDLIVLGGQWLTHRNAYKEPLARSLDTLRRLGLRVIVLGPAIEYRRPLPELLIKHLKKRPNKPLRTEKLFEPEALRIEQDLKQGDVPLRGAKLVSIWDLMCRKMQCPTLTPEGVPVQWDKHHLTAEGSLLQARKLFPVIESELKRTPPRE